MQDHRQRLALVTGASRGIGRAIAVALAQQGFKLALVARTRSDLQATAAACLEAGATDAFVHEFDLGEAEAVSAFCRTVLEHYGHVDVLVNNAGIGVEGNAVAGDPDAWTKSMWLNVLVPMRLTRCFAPGMVEQGWGTIVNIGSVAAIEGMTESGAYAASKHAIRGWSLSCSLKLRDAGIKVVLLNPAYVDTAMTEGVRGADRSRMLRPEDVAEAALLALRTSAACCPQEITLRLTRRPVE